MERQEWLEGLKEGDKVAVQTHTAFGTRYELKPVTRITPTRIIKVDGKQYTSEGREKGVRSTWDIRSTLQPITKDVLEHRERAKLIGKLGNLNVKALSLQQLRGIDRALNEEEKKDKKTMS
ncbi:hypothetical protein IMZ31_23480 (plasmid) [Pontibacillus sp. ALD_SL1]|uniref:hypothetical protein n=1 Tax=Pontibacillus sp. ALD_SL1 TaxID=2777185 RepID=UPI001A97D15E|nr:hypothetical protein [Pontibacillus sp. ALD_SL1]QST02415.1 hypothetical protein IMZ31_23480 [Pontibacillus sp. ALD_SL1]